MADTDDMGGGPSPWEDELTFEVQEPTELQAVVDARTTGNDPTPPDLETSPEERALDDVAEPRNPQSAKYGPSGEDSDEITDDTGVGERAKLWDTDPFEIEDAEVARAVHVRRELGVEEASVEEPETTDPLPVRPEAAQVELRAAPSEVVRGPGSSPSNRRASRTEDIVITGLGPKDEPMTEPAIRPPQGRSPSSGRRLVERAGRLAERDGSRDLPVEMPTMIGFDVSARTVRGGYLDREEMVWLHSASASSWPAIVGRAQTGASVTGASRR
ncbi:MAG: hypothetical protein HC923_11960, partial [Myxococcales bacterium]|nr:hypothetical protein [Myxococcales bacterium]